MLLQVAICMVFTMTTWTIRTFSSPLRIIDGSIIKSTMATFFLACPLTALFAYPGTPEDKVGVIIIWFFLGMVAWLVAIALEVSYHPTVTSVRRLVVASQNVGLKRSSREQGLIKWILTAERIRRNVNGAYRWDVLYTTMGFIAAIGSK